MAETILDLSGNVIVADEFRAPGSGGTAATEAFVLAETKEKTETVALVALTDSSTGTSGGNTIAAVSDVATAANAIATLSAKLNAVIAALKA